MKVCLACGAHNTWQSTGCWLCHVELTASLFGDVVTASLVETERQARARLGSTIVMGIAWVIGLPAIFVSFGNLNDHGWPVWFNLAGLGLFPLLLAISSVLALQRWAFLDRTESQAQSVNRLWVVVSGLSAIVAVGVVLLWSVGLALFALCLSGA